MSCTRGRCDTVWSGPVGGHDCTRGTCGSCGRPSPWRMPQGLPCPQHPRPPPCPRWRPDRSGATTSLRQGPPCPVLTNTGRSVDAHPQNRQGSHSLGGSLQVGGWWWTTDHWPAWAGTRDRHAPPLPSSARSERHLPLPCTPNGHPAPHSRRPALCSVEARQRRWRWGTYRASPPHPPRNGIHLHLLHLVQLLCHLLGAPQIKGPTHASLRSSLRIRLSCIHCSQRLSHSLGYHTQALSAGLVDDPYQRK